VGLVSSASSPRPPRTDLLPLLPQRAELSGIGYWRETASHSVGLCHDLVDECHRPKQIEADLGGSAEPAGKAGPKPSFPSDDGEQTALVFNALIEAGAALNAADVAARFKQGQRIRPAVSSVLVSLSRLGLISISDGGRTFAYRRAA
jgi:hypothetical protein